MVKLVYETAVLGSISLEYDRPVITVGRIPGNDLVLPHPSVRDQHCQLSFKDQSVVVAPMDASTAPDEYKIGQTLAIGEVVFHIERSENTVELPHETAAIAPLPVETPETPFFCEQCQVLYASHEVKRIGLKGQKRHLLCPHCSHPVIRVLPDKESRAGFFTRLAKKVAEVWKA